MAGRIIAAVNAEMRRRRLDQMRGAIDIAGRFLHTDEPRHLRATQNLVSLLMSATVRPGTLYRITGRSTVSAIFTK